MNNVPCTDRLTQSILWCLCIAPIVFGSMSIQCRDTEVHADCKPEVELESCPQEMFSFITVPSSRTLWHISHWMCCCCSFSFTVFILYHCCVLVLLELLLLLFMLLLSISINWSMYLYSIWYFICMLDCLASEWWWLSNWCGASRYGSVVSMGGCSLALTMILYLTEALYFRSSTLTFYVIFPCVLNCKFGYFFHFDPLVNIDLKFLLKKCLFLSFTAITLIGLIYIPKRLRLWDPHMDHDDENSQLLKQMSGFKKRRAPKKMP